MQHALATLRERFPELGPIFANLLDLANFVRSENEPQVFFEPKSMFDMTDDKPVLTGVTAADVNAWRHHVADSSLVKMQALEDAVLTELLAEHLTASIILVRAHMEVAGLATYCCEQLFNAARKEDWQSLLKAMHQTNFGTSMRIQADGRPRVDQMISETEIRPLRPGDLIKAMDRFANHEKINDRFQPVYGLLSEMAHPVMRGNRLFRDVLEETRDGWRIRYRPEQGLDMRGARMALEALLANMRIGYANAALLDAADVRPDDGRFTLDPPSEAAVETVWVHLLQREKSKSDGAPEPGAA